jgi:excinuclease ABC subunit B
MSPYYAKAFYIPYQILTHVCVHQMAINFKLTSNYQPKGDQPEAIQKLVNSIQTGNRYQTLWGVTGSGKTFSMANVIQSIQRPTLIIAHNKTLAAQLYSEFKSFFPENAVEYFVSYYDYYQPEAYIPQTDTFIEKDSAINDEIDRLRIAATSALVSRQDVIVVASVSCIYGLGSPEDFQEMMILLKKGEIYERKIILERLVQNLYERNEIDFARGKFRVRGENIDIFPAYMETFIRIQFWDETVESIQEMDPLTGNVLKELDIFPLYPAKQYITSRPKLELGMKDIRSELDEQVAHFESTGKLIEAQRIRMRTEYDLELLNELGVCQGIENYSRHLSRRLPGERPFCLIDFFPKDFLLIIDESHVTLPQIRGMYFGDFSRKTRLVEFGFRLPSALDNRPLRPEEFSAMTVQTLFVSATPSVFEFEHSTVIAEQIIRPTGLLDPLMEIRPIKGQIENLMEEIQKAIAAQERILVTTYTKRMSEEVSSYLRKFKIRAEYLHSDIDAIERIEILKKLRQGGFDVLVGVNLLREGLDLPEVALVAILDADKEGFLRSHTSLIQTAGRAARHERGRVILYADVLTESLKKTIALTNHRRNKQIEYNQKHGITPRSAERNIQLSLHQNKKPTDPITLKEAGGDADLAAVIDQLEAEMLAYADKLEFEKAALVRDQLEGLKKQKKKNQAVKKKSAKK